MDVFFEQILVKKPNTVQKVMKIAIIFTAFVLVFSLLFAAFVFIAAGQIISGLLFMAAVGVGWGTKWYIKRLYLEYEYSITNGDFDIDRIVGKSKRDRMITTSCRNFTEFGVFDADTRQRFLDREFSAKVLAANLDEENLFYAVVDHKSLGAVLLVLQPDERIKTALEKFIPKSVQKDVLSGN